MKTLLLSLVFVLGCATSRPTPNTGRVTYSSYQFPVEMPRNVASGHTPNYFNQHAHGVFTVKNGTSSPLTQTLDCGNYMPTVEVPPYREQDVLVDTTPAHLGEQLCSVVSE